MARVGCCRGQDGIRSATESPTLKHIKSLLSGIFAHAKRQGYFSGENPARDTAIPPTSNKGEETYAYSIEEVVAMLVAVPEPGRSVIATAAFTGASRSELMGMRWEDWHDDAIYIDRSVWNGKVGEPKTRDRKAPIPMVVQRLVTILENHRLAEGNPKSGPIFRSSTGAPLELNNLLNRVILPALNRCKVCQKSESDHEKQEHEFKRDDSRPMWRGWHAFRRGLATNLNQLGVDDKTIQAILRHSNVATTQAHYIKPVSVASIAAMKSLDALLCSLCAQPEADSARMAVN